VSVLESNNPIIAKAFITVLSSQHTKHL